MAGPTQKIHCTCGTDTQSVIGTDCVLQENWLTVKARILVWPKTRDSNEESNRNLQFDPYGVYTNAGSMNSIRVLTSTPQVTFTL